ncbi:unnamed protein product, partial [Heterotrigona itama]
ELKMNEEHPALQSRLDHTSLELGSLKQVLHERFFVPPLAHLSNAPKPSEAEADPTGQENRLINIVNTNQLPIQVQISLTHNPTPPYLLSISETSAIPDLKPDFREFLENDSTL